MKFEVLVLNKRSMQSTPANGSGETDFLGRVLIRGVCGWVKTGSICQRVGMGWG